MSTIDERIVSMEFRNSQFLNGIKTTLAALTGLKSSLNLNGATKNVADLDNAAQSLNHGGLSKIGTTIEGVNGKFLALATIGVTALSNITNKAITAGQQIVKSLTVEPIMDGLREYETNLNAVQTIMANTGLTGQKGLDKVNTSLNDLNHYSDLTIYNFSEMAKNIGTFTAAGVDLKTSTNAIKGVANLAALSGSSSEQASTAMYQLSQALAAGKVTLMDWNSLVNAGMGGKVLQDALKQTARAHGVAVDSIIKKNGSFRDSLQEGWITSDIMTETLSKFTGDLSDAQLKAQGYTKDQIKQIQTLAKTAQDAATKIKTGTQLMDTLKESVGSSWSQTWQILFGDFAQAKTLFTGIYNAINPIISASGNARNALLKGWADLGGRDSLIQGVANAFHAIMDVIKPVQEAFRTVFPPTTSEQLFKMTEAFEKFTKNLIPSKKTVEDIKRIFTGFFSVLGIGVAIVKGFAGAIGQAIKTLSGGTGGLLDWLAGLADFGTKAKKTVDSGKGLQTFFDKLGAILSAAVMPITHIGDAFQYIIGILGQVWAVMEPFAAKIGSAFSGVGDAIASGIESGGVSNLLHIFTQGAFAAILVAIRGWIVKLKKATASGGGILDNIKKMFGGLTETLEAMQTQLKAQALKEIAIAVALLAGSLAVLSFIDPAKLVKALSAITIMFTQLLAAMAIVDKIAKSGAIASIGAIGAAMVLLSTSILILSGAVALLGQLSWQSLVKGLSAVAVMLATLAGALKLMGPAKGMIATGLGLNLLAGAIALLAGSVAIFATMSWESIGKGMASVAAALLIIAGAMRLMPTAQMIILGPTLLLVAAAIAALAGAMKIMGGMSWEAIGKGMVVLAGSLLILAGGMALMEEALPGAAALLVVSAALAIFVPVLLTLGSMDWGSILTGLGALAAIFAVLAVAGLALTPVIPALLGLGIAVALLGVGVAAAGIGVAALGTGLTLLAAGGTAAIAALVAAVSAFAGLIPMIFKQIGQGIVEMAGVIATAGPAIVGALTTILMSLLSAIEKVVPKALTVFTKLMLGLLKAIDTIAPKLVSTAVHLITLLLNAIVNLVPKFVVAGLQIITGVLNGIANNVGKMVTAATNIVVNFIRGITQNLPRVVQAGIDMVISFINSLANGIRDNTAKVNAAIDNLVDAMITAFTSTLFNFSDIGSQIVAGLAGGIRSGVGAVVDAAQSVASSALSAAKNFLGIHSPSKEFEKLGVFVNKGFIKGLKSNDAATVKATLADMKSGLKDLLKSTAEDADKASEKLAKLTKARHQDADAIAKARKELKTANKEHAEAKKAYTALTKSMKQSETHLTNLAKKYDANAAKLAKYKQQLTDAKKAYWDYRNSVTDQYDTLPDFLDNATHDKNVQKAQDKYDALKVKVDAAAQSLADANKEMQDSAAALKEQFDKLPDITSDTTAESYIQSLTDQVAATAKFNKDMKTLRSLGLNDANYQNLLAKGLDAQPFIDSLIADGPAAVAQVNSLGDQLASAAGQLGSTASQELYQAGVDSAKSVLDGLQKQLTTEGKNVSAASAKVVADYIADIKAQTAAAKKYKSDLQKLLDLGLNDQTYEELVGKGPEEGQAFVTGLLATGKYGVAQVNVATADLASAANNMGKQAAEEMYRAGINTAQGLVDGIKAKQKDLDAQMDRLADRMVTTLKKKLGIHSPSRVMMGLGDYTGQGLIKGLENTRKDVANAAAGLGDASINSLKNTLTGLDTVVTDNMDLNPTIKPVLDLTDVQKTAGQLDGMVSTTSISTDATSAKADSASAEVKAAREAIKEEYKDVLAASAKPTFIQNNTSPKALSQAEIYRQTKNQISRAKGVLTNS